MSPAVWYLPVGVLLGGALALQAQADTSAPSVEVRWQVVHDGRLGAVLVERALYTPPDSSTALIRVRIRNRSPRTVGVDLYDAWNVVFLNQWGPSPAPRRLVIDEGELRLAPMSPEDTAALLDRYRKQVLVMIPPGRSEDYFREFAGRRPSGAASDNPYLILSLSGRLWVTDGQVAEDLTLIGAPPETRDVVLRLPVPWCPLPAAGRVVAPR